MARNDRLRAAAMMSEHKRAAFDRSADAWFERAIMLDKQEKDFNARAAASRLANPRRRKLERAANG